MHMNGSVGFPQANQVGLHLTYLQLTGCPSIFSVSMTELQGYTQLSIAANHESASGQGSLLTLQVSHRPMNTVQCFLIFSSDGSSHHLGSGTPEQPHMQLPKPPKRLLREQVCVHLII